MIKNRLFHGMTKRSSTCLYVLAVAVVLLSYVLAYADLFTCKRSFSHDSLIWYGTFHYYLENITQGAFPYWDPYSLTGTPFYPNISGYGLLDPIVLICALLAKAFAVSPLTLFIYFRLYRLLFFAAGAFLLFKRLSRSVVISVVSSGMLLFIITMQNSDLPKMDYGYTIPLAFYLILLLLDNLGNAKRYRYLFCLALVTGITMNVFIPTLYVFSIVLFLAALFLFRQYRWKDVFSAFTDKAMLLSVAAAALLVLMMTSPPLTVSLLDTTENGELFPIGKLVDSNNGRFKVMTASDTGGDLFFDKIRNNAASFLSPASLLGLLTPDPSVLRFPAAWQNSQSFYMGITTVLLILFGLFYARSRLMSAVLMVTVVLFLNMFNFTGHNGSYNWAQQLMNNVFPPLRMIDMRMNFSSVLSFCLCLLLCLSASSLAAKDGIASLARSRFPSLLAICLAFVALKVAINITYGGSVFLSRHESLILALPLVLGAGLAAVRFNLISGSLLVSAVLIVSLIEMTLLGVGNASVFMESDELYRFLRTKNEYRTYDPGRLFEGTEYFRIPTVPMFASPLPAFIETMIPVKSALISNPDIAIFTTKRYYDLFSYLPVENRLVLDGVVYPIVRFFPEAAAFTIKSRCDMLDALRGDNPFELGQKLYLEGEGLCPRQTAIDLRNMKNLDGIESGQVRQVYRNYFRDIIGAIRSNPENFLTTADSRLRLKQVSVNETRVAVQNAIGGYLLYTDGWSKYWKAYDGDRQLPLIIANYNSKAVFLPAGRHRVRFVYCPVYYKVALILYYAGLILSGIFITVAWRREKKLNRVSRPEKT